MINTEQIERRISDLVDARLLGLQDIEFEPEILFDVNEEDTPERLIEVLTNPSYIGWAAETLLGDKFFPIQIAVLNELWNRPYPMLIATRGGAKSFLLGRYAILRALLTQGSRIVIVGAAFRQSQKVFQYASDVWYRSALVRDLVGSGIEQGPRYMPDRWTLRLGDSQIIALPLGTGDTIRGERACVGPNTLVETTLGSIKIVDCPAYFLDPNFAVLTPGGPERPLSFIQTLPTESYEIICAGGYSFVCSSIHKVMTSSGFQLAKDLKPGQHLLLESSGYFPPNYPQYLNSDICWMLGLLTSGGSVGQRDIVISTQKEEVIKEFISKSIICFGIEPERRGGKGVYRVASASGVRLLNSFGYPNFPDCLFSTPQEGVKEFIRGLLIRFNSKKIPIKEELKKQVQYLLKKLDLHCSLTVEGIEFSSSQFERLQSCLENKSFLPKKRYISVQQVKQLSGLSILYDFSLPSNECFYGNHFVQHNTHVVADEFRVIPPDIYENVVGGFAIVSANPVESAKEEIQKQLMRELNLPFVSSAKPNQSIIASSAYYSFDNFCNYWKRWKSIVESKGNPDKLFELFNGPPEEGFDWRHYSVMRLPVEIYPKGFIDPQVLAKQKITTTKGNYLVEYGAVFAGDSDGFFRRTLVESCVVGKNKIVIENEPIYFTSSLVGQPNFRYVYGVDPASERANFSIVVIELHSSHRRIVYVWTTTKELHRLRLKKKLTSENDFFFFTANKLRQLATVFPPAKIMVDSQGGGYALAEALHNSKGKEEGHQLIWPEINDEEPQDFDTEPGLHVLEFATFRKLDWLTQANNGLKKDMEEKILLFPAFDAAELALAKEEDIREGREKLEGEALSLTETLEDCALEIEELKDELASIVVTQTPHSRQERWEAAGGGRKDRYSALLMANAAAKSVQEIKPVAEPTPGGSIYDFVSRKPMEEKWIGPSWYVEKVKNAHKYYGKV